MHSTGNPIPIAAMALEMDLGDLRASAVLGRGAKGVVFLVQNTSGESLALKVIDRSSLEKKTAAVGGGGGSGGDVYKRIWFERDVLRTLRHPLLPSLRGFVSTDRIVAFVIDRCSGGDLASLRRRQTEKMFSDDIIRFYAAELVIALEYLHGLGIAYRDLKPENILVQDNGHLMLIDFDLSAKLPLRPPDTPDRHRHPNPHPATPNKPSHRRRRSMFGCLSFGADVSPEVSVSPNKPIDRSTAGSPANSSSSDSLKSNSFVGTEEYVAPEIIAGNGHDFAVDCWSLGIVLYEMLYGRTPFRGQNRKETFYRTLTKDPELVGERTPLRDLISRLLEKDPERRIGLEEIKQHEFFRGLDWESVLLISRPPFIPSEGADWDEFGKPIPTHTDTDTIDVEKVVQEVFEKREMAEKISNGKRGDAIKAEDFSGF